MHSRRRRMADGFDEWTVRKNTRHPLWFHRNDSGLILFAAPHKSWFPEKNQLQTTFTIITCEPDAPIAPIHNLMPLVFDQRPAEDCMNPLENDPSLKRLLTPAP
jgi:putative SOS response-associated peptidase YedK